MNFEKLIERLSDSGIEIKYHEPMSRHTTFRIGGSAAFYLIPHTDDELRRGFAAIQEAGCKFFVLGNGSNVVFPDEGYDGAVLSMEAMRSIRVCGERLICGAGASLSQAAKVAGNHGLTGMEFAYGIPGSCGGAAFMNAGAYGGEISHILESSSYVDEAGGHTLSLPEHEYAYRSSSYRNNPGRIITEVVFKLRKGDSVAIQETMNDLMQRRISKQPLEYPSAGSVFKRPAGRFTGQMIEEAGLKGFSIGGAQVSEKHAGFIINTGNATAKDVKSLIARIQTTIREKFDCSLECEVIFVE